MPIEMQIEKTARSKYAWGKSKSRSAAEVTMAIEAFFSKLIVPAAWVCKGSVRISNDESELLSEGYVFEDARARDPRRTKYKVVYILAPERGAICERTESDRGGVKYNCVVSNKTIEELNTFIEQKYYNLEE